MVPSLKRKSWEGVDSSEFEPKDVQYILQSSQRDLDHAISDSMMLFTVSLVCYVNGILECNGFSRKSGAV